MSRIRLTLVAATAAVTLVPAVPVAQAGAEAHKGQVVTVTMTEFRFALSTAKVHPGKVAFRLANKGKLAHDFRIAGATSALVKAGKTATLVVTLKKGKYPYTCTVKGHAAAGMKGVLAVA
jgi:uncharacterized cupredoxin-like copper-binding protein